MAYETIAAQDPSLKQAAETLRGAYADDEELSVFNSLDVAEWVDLKAAVIANCRIDTPAQSPYN
jgi:hypothetical protein